VAYFKELPADNLKLLEPAFELRLLPVLIKHRAVGVDSGHRDSHRQSGRKHIELFVLKINHPSEGLDITLHSGKRMIDLPGNFRRIGPLDPVADRYASMRYARPDILLLAARGYDDSLFTESRYIATDRTHIAVQQTGQILLS